MSSLESALKALQQASDLAESTMNAHELALKELESNLKGKELDQFKDIKAKSNQLIEIAKTGDINRVNELINKMKNDYGK